MRWKLVGNEEHISIWKEEVWVYMKVVSQRSPGEKNSIKTSGSLVSQPRFKPKTSRINT
jgi:hypothetical protein